MNTSDFNITKTIEMYKQLMAELKPVNETIYNIVKLQLEITREVANEVFERTSRNLIPTSIMGLMKFDFFEINDPDDIELWVIGTHGDPDEIFVRVGLDQLMIEGKVDEYELKTRAILEAERTKIEAGVLAEFERKRMALQREMDSLNQKISSLSR